MLQSLQQNLTTGVVASCAMGLALTGANNLDFTREGSPLIGGIYQRTVEQDYKNNFPLRDLSCDVWNALQLAVFDQTHAEVIHTSNGWLFTAEEFRQPTNDYQFSTEVLAAREALATQNIQLVPLIVPDKARVYKGELAHPRTAALEARYDAVLEFLITNNFQTADLRSPLIELSEAQLAFMKTDTHWSPAGAKAVAATIAAKIPQAVFETSSFETQWAAPTPYDGDLLTFVDTGSFAVDAAFGGETIELAQTQAVGSELSLLGDVDIPVTLVGTSYSAKPEFNFEGFLKAALGADVLNVAKMGQGPFKPMRDYLASDDLKSSPPQLVVWEIPERYIPTQEFDR